MIKVIDYSEVGISGAKAKLEADAAIRKAVNPISRDTVEKMRTEMRSLGFFDSGETDDSFKKWNRTKFGILEGVGFKMKRNAIILAQVGKDYRWESVAGRYEITKGNNIQDFIFTHITDAAEEIADVVTEINADMVVKRLFPTK